MIALALGGGAALGWAHIGVLRVLEAEGIAVGAVAGTSIGALAATCLAAGRLDVLEEVARAARRRTILRYLDPHLGRGAILGGRRIEAMLERHLGDWDLEELDIPISLVTTQLATGDEERLTCCPAARAVRASMAIPGLFKPVQWADRLLVDGGMVANLPLGAARELAPHLPLVAVDLFGDYPGIFEEVARKPSARAIGRAGFQMLIRQQTQEAIRRFQPEVVIAPRIGHRSTGHFHLGEELIEAGAVSARAALPQIRAALAA